MSANANLPPVSAPATTKSLRAPALLRRRSKTYAGDEFIQPTSTYGSSSGINSNSSGSMGARKTAGSSHEEGVEDQVETNSDNFLKINKAREANRRKLSSRRCLRVFLKFSLKSPEFILTIK